MALDPKSGTAVERLGRRRGDDRPLFMAGPLEAATAVAHGGEVMLDAAGRVECELPLYPDGQA